MALLADEYIEPPDRFLNARAQHFMPLLEPCISFGNARACRFARGGRAFDPPKRALQPCRCRVESLFRHDGCITVPAYHWQRLLIVQAPRRGGLAAGYPAP